MKTIYFYPIAIFIILLSCTPIKHLGQLEVRKDTFQVSSGSNFSIECIEGEAFNHPTFAIWQEDMEGNYIKTIFVTKAYASGVFGYKMNHDSVWFPLSGESHQPAALPYWTHKKGLIDNKKYMPNPEHPFVDAYTGATPKGSFVFDTYQQNSDKQYRILMEVNQAWDWNEYWVNDKYSDNKAYQHSAQPSVVYAATINNTVKEYYLNPIGHSHPKGENGDLFTNLSTISTAKNIYSSIKISIK